MFGGGGFDGTHPNVAGNVPLGPADQLLPLGRGYATFASDSGHQAGALGSLDGTVPAQRRGAAQLRRRGAQEDARRRHLPDQGALRGRLRSRSRTSPAARPAAARRSRSITRWPDDWDGAIAWYPAWNQAVGDARRPPRQPRAGAAGRLSEHRQAAAAAALRRCRPATRSTASSTALISNQLRCNAVFDPATASVNGVAAALRRRRRHRRHLPVGRADHRAEDDQHRRAVPLRARQRRGPLSRLQRLGRRPRHHDATPSPIEPTVTFLDLGTVAAGDRRCRRPRPTSAGRSTSSSSTAITRVGRLQLAVARPREPRPVGRRAERAEHA